MRLVFKPWRQFSIRMAPEYKPGLLSDAGVGIERTFLVGLAGSKSGLKHPGLPRRSSAPGEYPANQFGTLARRTRKIQQDNHVEVGSSARHARFLMGTRKMAKRKMFDDAIKEALPGVFANHREMARWG